MTEEPLVLRRAVKRGGLSEVSAHPLAMAGKHAGLLD